MLLFKSFRLLIDFSEANCTDVCMSGALKAGTQRLWTRDSKEFLFDTH